MTVEEVLRGLAAPVIWVDSRVQTGVDLITHWIMDSLGVARWFVRYGAQLLFVVFRVGHAFSHQTPKELIILICLPLYELQRHFSSKHEELGADPVLPGLRYLWAVLKVLSLLFLIGAIVDGDVLMAAGEVAWLFNLYTWFTPLNPPPRKRRREVLKPAESMG